MSSHVSVVESFFVSSSNLFLTGGGTGIGAAGNSACINSADTHHVFVLFGSLKSHPETSTGYHQ